MVKDDDKKPAPPSGERIAKVLARRGVASRRGVEAMIAEGRVAVNGAVIDSPALNVAAKDRITVDGKPIPDEAPPQLWLYHKPIGLVTTEKDEKDRPTVFASLPPELGRVMSVGRLDMNSEGLLLLTNDGGIKRRLELPSTGWLRRYRVRVHGAPKDSDIEPLRHGIEIEGVRFLPMEVEVDRLQGANAWLTVGIREGKNREVRRAMEEIGLKVNRLIRISYGPFRLGELKPGEVSLVRPRVLRDQLGLVAEAVPDEPPAGTSDDRRGTRAALPRRGAKTDGRVKPAGAGPARGMGKREDSPAGGGGKPAPFKRGAPAEDKPGRKPGGKFQAAKGRPSGPDPDRPRRAPRDADAAGGGKAPGTGGQARSESGKPQARRSSGPKGADAPAWKTREGGASRPRREGDSPERARARPASGARPRAADAADARPRSSKPPASKPQRARDGASSGAPTKGRERPAREAEKGAARRDGKAPARRDGAPGADRPKGGPGGARGGPGKGGPRKPPRG